MAEGRECSKCGAAVEIQDTRYCGYCGAELPLPESDPELGVEGRFAALAVHPDAKRALAATEAGPGAGSPPSPEWHWLFIAAGVVFVPLVLLAARGSEAWKVVRLLPVAAGLLVCVAIVLLIIAALVKNLPVAPTPGYRGPAGGKGRDRSKHLVRVLSTSTDVKPWGDTVAVKHLAMLQWPSGERHTIAVASPALSRTLAHDDMGVATIVGGRLVTFERVEI